MPPEVVHETSNSRIQVLEIEGSGRQWGGK